MRNGNRNGACKQPNDIIKAHGVVVSLLFSMWEVLGSIPSVSMLKAAAARHTQKVKITNRSKNAKKITPAIAQLVEHLTVDSCSNQMVPGSIPGGRILRLLPRRGSPAGDAITYVTGKKHAEVLHARLRQRDTETQTFLQKYPDRS